MTDDADAVLVPTARGALHATDRPGEGPAIVLMHGFPDDSAIYDRLVPGLAGRRVVRFDFLGYGRSERPADPAADFDPVADLDAVLGALDLVRPVVVGHDASGPVAVDYTLGHPGRVGHVVLLNTFYGHAPGLHLPEMIRLLADPELVPLADAMLGDEAQRLWLLQHTARQFGDTELDPAGIAAVAVLPQYFGDGDRPDALGAIRAWTGRLFADLDQQDGRVTDGRLATLDAGVTVAFGEDDHYLNPQVARHLAQILPDADLHLIPDAAHWPQWDQPAPVAHILTALTEASP